MKDSHQVSTAHCLSLCGNILLGSEFEQFPGAFSGHVGYHGATWSLVFLVGFGSVNIPTLLVFFPNTVVVTQPNSSLGFAEELHLVSHEHVFSFTARLVLGQNLEDGPSTPLLVHHHVAQQAVTFFVVSFVAHTEHSSGRLLPQTNFVALLNGLS